jgi:hypothetical protein
MIASRRTVLAVVAAGTLADCSRPAGLAGGGRVRSAAPVAAVGSHTLVTVPLAVAPSALRRLEPRSRPGTATSDPVPGASGDLG